jgi:hypothetical protein
LEGGQSREELTVEASMSAQQGLGRLLGSVVAFLLVVSVLSMALNVVVIFVCRLLICVPQVLGAEGIPLVDCMSPVGEICEPGVQPTWGGCEVAWEDRPK